MSVIEEKKALRTYIRQTERTLDPAYKAESSEAICRCVLALEEYRAAGTVFARRSSCRAAPRATRSTCAWSRRWTSSCRGCTAF